MSLLASWIWNDTDPLPRNVLVQFRRTFTLATKPAQARLHLSADSRYLLYCNGVRLGYGPTRNYHFHYEYDTYDLTPHLRAGQNLIAIAVIHWGEGTFHQMVGRAGLLAQLDLDDQPPLLSDATWKAKRSAAYRQAVPRIACQMAWEEQIDARLADAGWATLGFDDGAWASATVIGPVGMAPWGALSPRTIPFLTDEPLTPIRAASLGLVRRPEVVAALHAGPYLAPGDLSSNRQVVDALIATVLHVPHAGEVRLKRCSVAGGDPPTGDVLRIFLNSQRLQWQPDPIADYGVTLTLPAGEHILLIDWNGKTHDMDMTLTASGMEGLSTFSPLPGHSGTWAIATHPNDARPAALAATSCEALLQCGANWQPVSALDTPETDVFMDITASTPITPHETAMRWPIRVAPVPAGQAHHYLIDFGREAIGWLDFEIDAPAGTTVDLLGFEAVQEGQRQLTYYLNNTLRYICAEGRQTYASTLRRGLRYLIVAVHGNVSEAVLSNISLRLSTYPWATQGTFRCSDPRLNQIWELCNYTLRLCSEDTYTDCPTYEQTFWTGDACYTDVMLHQVVHGDARLPRRCLLLVADSLKRLPIGGAQVPGDWENDILPNWSWLWAMGCAEFYTLTGDEAFAREVYPALAQQARFIEAHRNASGIIALPGFWHLLDWAKMAREPEDIVAHESSLAVAALKATAIIAQVAGHPTEAKHWQSLAAQLTESINREYWRADRQAYADQWLAPGQTVDAVSQPTNIVTLLAGVAPADRATVIAPNLVACPEDWIRLGTPWMQSLGHLVLAQRGQLGAALDSIRDRWGDMLDKGATTTWETFSGHEPDRWTRSWCHAWSAFPAYLMSAYVLGIRPLEPGYQRALIAPQLDTLTWAEGQVPTPHGNITVRAERGLIQIALPEGVAANIRLPAQKTMMPIIRGAEAQWQFMDDEIEITLPPGAQAVISLGL